MTSSKYHQRQAKLVELTEEKGLAAMVLNPGPDLSYLTGIDFHLMERPVVAFFPNDGDPVLVLPELEGQKVVGLEYPLKTHFYSEDTSTWVGAFQSALADAGISTGSLGASSRHLRLLEISFIEQAAPELKLVSGAEILSELRILKSEDEIARIDEAVRIAECALASTLPGVKPGLTEKELASRLVGRLLHEGSEPVRRLP